MFLKFKVCHYWLDEVKDFDSLSNDNAQKFCFSEYIVKLTVDATQSTSSSYMIYPLLIAPFNKKGK